MDNVTAQSSGSGSSGVVISNFRQQIDDLVEKITSLNAENFLQKQKIELENQQNEMNRRLRANERFTSNFCVVVYSPPSTQLIQDIFMVTLKVFYDSLGFIYLKIEIKPVIILQKLGERIVCFC